MGNGEEEYERYHLGSQIDKNKIHSLTFFIPKFYHETLKTISEKKKIKINNPKNERSQMLNVLFAEPDSNSWILVRQDQKKLAMGFKKQ